MIRTKGDLKEFLKMRNNIVHSAERRYSIEEIKTLVEKIDNSKFNFRI